MRTWRKPTASSYQRLPDDVADVQHEGDELDVVLGEGMGLAGLDGVLRLAPEDGHAELLLVRRRHAARC